MTLRKPFGNVLHILNRSIVPSSKNPGAQGQPWSAENQAGIEQLVYYVVRQEEFFDQLQAQMIEISHNDLFRRIEFCRGAS